MREETTTQAYQRTAIEQYRKRVEYAKTLPKIENAQLLAGQPMFFYCKSCGVPTESLPEDYLFTPYQRCSQCQGLKDEGLLAIAERSVRDNS